MADITDLTGLITGVAVYFAEPATPTKYDYMCGLNGRGVDQTRERKSDTAVLDCGPDASIDTLSTSGAYDWQVSGDATMQLKTFGTFALVEISVFIVLLFVAFVYVWRRGALEWK